MDGSGFYREVDKFKGRKKNVNKQHKANREAIIKNYPTDAIKETEVSHIGRYSNNQKRQIKDLERGYLNVERSLPVEEPDGVYRFANRSIYLSVDPTANVM